MYQLLRHTELFSFKGLWNLFLAICKQGVNVSVIVRTAAKLYPNQTALVFENEQVTYKELDEHVLHLAGHLQEKYGLKKGGKMALICANHPPHVYAMFAAACIGMDIYFLNPDMGSEGLRSIIRKQGFDFIIYDSNIKDIIQEVGYQERSMRALVDILPLIKKEANNKTRKKLNFQRSNFRKIVVLTSGSTGEAKAAARKTSATAFISPFLSLIEKLNLSSYRSLYLATPVYHGFGLAALFVALLMGKTIYMRSRFDAQDACDWIKDCQIEVITVVPSMLQRMLQTNGDALRSLQCIISGGAALSPVLIKRTKECLSGNKIFNLYGTSEAGFCMMATPADLDYSEKTIGKPLKGVEVEIISKEGVSLPIGKVGEMCIKCKWSVRGDQWIHTGDLAYRDGRGYYFLMGRTDDMIVSGGENVYPCELEYILQKHISVQDVMVVGVSDPDFGQRLKAFVIPSKKNLSESELREWLSSRCARYQMPREIVFMKEFPLTGTGKKDRNLIQPS